ncbi:MAG: tetratricopeptide repeat protein, partial [Nitrosopumilus sp.]|nr:tetratricopeptide repeat protein [Nitrosopumilus sp.]
NSSDDNSSDDNSSDDNSSDDNSSDDNSSDDNSSDDNSSDDNIKTEENLLDESSEAKEEKSNTNTPEITTQRKTDNLSVEDIELGIILNQINLECDKSTYSDTISYYDGMGPALYRLCKFDNSLQFFSESLLEDPDNAEILTNKGSALGKLGYYKDAILHYNKAIEIDSTFLPALNNKANALANIGNYEEAISLYAEVLGKNPSYVTARQNLETVLSEMPQKNSLTLQQISFQNENNHETSISMKTSDQIKLQKEKSPDLFEQIDSILSSIVSLFVNTT